MRGKRIRSQMCQMIWSFVIVVTCWQRHRPRRVVIVMWKMMVTLAPHGSAGSVGRRLRQLSAHVSVVAGDIVRGARLCLRGVLLIVLVVVARTDSALKVGQMVNDFHTTIAIDRNLTEAFFARQLKFTRLVFIVTILANGTGL